MSRQRGKRMGKLQAIGKVHIKDIKVLKEWHASGEFKKWDKGNWSPSCAASNRIKWEDTDQIGFYQMQERIPELSKSLDRTDSWIGELLEMAEYLQSIGQSLNLLYLDDQNRFAVISGADTEEAYTLPCRFLEIEEYKDYFRLRAGSDVFHRWGNIVFHHPRRSGIFIRHRR